MKIDEYLFRNKISITDFSKKIGCNRNWMTQIISGKKKPSIKLAKLIEQETGGKVKASTLLIRDLKYVLKELEKTS